MTRAVPDVISYLYDELFDTIITGNEWFFLRCRLIFGYCLDSAATGAVRWGRFIGCRLGCLFGLAFTIAGEVGIQTETISKYRMLQGNDHRHYQYKSHRCKLAEHHINQKEANPSCKKVKRINYSVIKARSSSGNSVNEQSCKELSLVAGSA